MKCKNNFNECYHSVTVKLLFMVIFLLVINFILILSYIGNVFEKDLLVVILFFGNMVFLIDLFIQIRTFFRMRKIKSYLVTSGLLYKIKEIEYWNDLDTIFTDIGIVTIQKGKAKHISYHNIKKIKRQEIHKANSLHYHSSIFGDVRYDYLIITLVNKEEYSIRIEIYPEGTRCASSIFINRLIPFILSKNQEILEDSAEIHSVYESMV